MFKVCSSILPLRLTPKTRRGTEKLNVGETKCVVDMVERNLNRRLLRQNVCNSSLGCVSSNGNIVSFCASEGTIFGKCLLSLISLNVCVSVSEEKCTTVTSNSNCKPRIKNRHLVIV